MDAVVHDRSICFSHLSVLILANSGLPSRPSTPRRNVEFSTSVFLGQSHKMFVSEVTWPRCSNGFFAFKNLNILTEQLLSGAEIKCSHTFFLIVWMFTGVNLGGLNLSWAMMSWIFQVFAQCCWKSLERTLVKRSRVSLSFFPLFMD